MNTSATAGDTSLADVDSIDTPPRVTPSPSPIPKTASAAARKKSSTRSLRGGGMEDVFGSHTSSSASDHSHRSAKQAQSDHADHQGNPMREGSGHSTGTTATSATTATHSSLGTVTRTRVPSKESLYRSRSHNKKAHTHPRPLSSHTQRTTTRSWLAGDGESSAILAHGAASQSAPALAEQYGGAKATGRSPKDAARATIFSTQDSSHNHSYTTKHTGRPESPTITTATSSSDTLLRRMQIKEKEFDEKIHVIHHTFQNAGEQLVLRDSIIVQLQEELADLRREASRIPTEYQAREEKLLRRVEEMMRDLREEQARTQQHRRAADEETRQLRAALTTADQQLAQQQRVSDDLLRQLRASDKALHEDKVKHAFALAETRQVYDAKLAEVQRAYHLVEKELAKAHARGEEVEKDRIDCQAKLLERELDSRRRWSADSLKVKELALERDALREEVEVVRLSMARLLQLMSEVPALSDYLQWNELKSEFVFLGYPTRYFANEGGARARSESRRPSPVRRRTGPAALTTSAMERSGVDSSAGQHPSPNITTTTSTASPPYYQDMNVSGVSFGETGVEDGMYAGVASALSKNVWLNGRWAQQMMGIIAAQNNFTRLKRIKLLELEETAQLSEQLPSARDVLENRRPEQDYWIPYAVFAEAQKFKNKYYPKLPAISHFYPFLIQLNKIWRARLQDRLRVRQGERQRSPQRQQPVAQVASSHCSRRRTRVAPVEGEVNSRMTSRSVTTSQLGARRSEELLRTLVQCEGRAEEIQAEHHRLRREVRLHISSQRSLQLFSLYDELIRNAHHSLSEVIELADDLYDGGNSSESAAEAQLATGAEEWMHATANALRAEQLQSQMKSDLDAAVDVRDRLCCVVERTCERVCDIGDTLSSRMMSYYSDLHQLIRILHHHIRQLRTRGDNAEEAEKSGGSANGSSSDFGGYEDSCEVEHVRGTRKEARRTAKPQQSLREALHAQYNATRPLAGAGASATTLPTCSQGSINVDSLLKLAASMLDFGDEVRKEVTAASAALRDIAGQAMCEAGQLCEES